MRSNTMHTSSVLLFGTLLIVAVFGLSVLHPEADQPGQQVLGQNGLEISSALDIESNETVDLQVPVDVDQILELREQVNRPLTGSFLNNDDTRNEFAEALEQVSGQSIIKQNDSLDLKGTGLPNPDSVSASELANQSASLLEQAAGRAQSTDGEFAESLRNLARKIRKKTMESTLAN